MRSIGVRELKEHTSQVVRRVRELGEEVEVTYRGRVVARLVPADRPRTTAGESADVWADLDRLADEITTRWPAGVSAADAVREERRAL